MCGRWCSERAPFCSRKRPVYGRIHPVPSRRHFLGPLYGYGYGYPVTVLRLEVYGRIPYTGRCSPLLWTYSAARLGCPASACSSLHLLYPWVTSPCCQRGLPNDVKDHLSVRQRPGQTTRWQVSCPCLPCHHGTVTVTGVSHHGHGQFLGEDDVDV